MYIFGASILNNMEVETRVETHLYGLFLWRQEGNVLLSGDQQRRSN